MAKEEEKKKDEVQIVDVPTQYVRAVQLEDGNVVSFEELAIINYKLLQEIKKAL